MYLIYNYILYNVPIFDFLPVHFISMFAWLFPDFVLMKINKSMFLFTLFAVHWAFC